MTAIMTSSSEHWVSTLLVSRASHLFPATLEQTHLLPSRILSPHARYYVREMRILAYSQLLQSYRSLTLESMGSAFGVSVEFIDKRVFCFCF